MDNLMNAANAPMMTAEENMRNSSYQYLIQRGYDDDEAYAIVNGRFAEYSARDAYNKIHADY